MSSERLYLSIVHKKTHIILLGEEILYARIDTERETLLTVHKELTFYWWNLFKW